MKYKQILIAFFISLPVGICLRLAQLMMLTDATGVLKNNERNNLMNYVAGVIILAIILASVVLGIMTRRRPTHVPKPTPFLTGTSAALSVACVFATMQTETPIAVLNYILIGFGLLSAAVFLFYAFTGVFEKMKPLPVLFILPVLFGIALVVGYFVNTNSKALPFTQRAFGVAIYCSLLLFLLEIAKQFNNISKKHTFRPLLAVGFLCSTISLTYAVPNLIVAVLSPSRAAGLDLSESAFFTVAGLFALSFVLAHYSSKNMTHSHRRHRSHGRNKRKPGRNPSDLYIG